MKLQELVGKTIESATRMGSVLTDDTGWIELRFTDGTLCVIESSYGVYSGESEYDYPTHIEIVDTVPPGVVPINELR